MLKNVTFGQFFPGQSFLHRMDPRMKLILTFALIVIVFVSQGFTGFAAILAFVVFTALSSKISLRFLLRGIRPILFLLLFTFVLNAFFQTGGTEIFRLGFLRMTDQGLRAAFFIAARLILLVVCTQMLTLTTSPNSLTDGLESLMRPLKRVRFPVHEIAMMMSIALRFIPTLLDEANKIMRAQMARGADFESGNFHPIDIRMCRCWCRCSSARSAARRIWRWRWRRAATAAARAARGCGSCAMDSATRSARARWPRCWPRSSS